MVKSVPGSNSAVVSETAVVAVEKILSNIPTKNWVKP